MDMFHFKICLALRYDAELISTSENSDYFILLREISTITDEMMSAFSYFEHACFLLDQIILQFMKFHSVACVGLDRCWNLLNDVPFY